MEAKEDILQSPVSLVPIKPEDANQKPTEFYSKARALSESVFRQHQIFYRVFTFSLFHAILIQVKFVWIDRRGA